MVLHLLYREGGEDPVAGGLPEWNWIYSPKQLLESSPNQMSPLKGWISWELQSRTHLTTLALVPYPPSESSGHIPSDLFFLDPITQPEAGIQLKLKLWCLLARYADSMTVSFCALAGEITPAAKERTNRDKWLESHAAFSVVLWMVKHEHKHCTLNWPSWSWSLALPCLHREPCRSRARWTQPSK